MAPRIITARSIGLEFITGRLSKLGPERSVVGHYSAMPRPSTFEAGIAEVRALHRDHLNRGLAGIAHHYAFLGDGSIIGCRPASRAGAHVMNDNEGRIGALMLGGPTDKPTRRQARAFNWLLHNAHTDAMPRRHRTERDLSELEVVVHNALVPTACPGLFRGMYLKGGEPFGDSLDGGEVEPTAKDRERVAGHDAGDTPAADAEAAALGPDADEARPDADDTLELPGADPEFDEDMAELLAELETREEKPSP